MSLATERATTVVAQLNRMLRLQDECERIFSELIEYKTYYVNDEAAWSAALQAMAALQPEPSTMFRRMNKHTDAVAAERVARDQAAA